MSDDTASEELVTRASDRATIPVEQLWGPSDIAVLVLARHIGCVEKYLLSAHVVVAVSGMPHACDMHVHPLGSLCHDCSQVLLRI
jgi:hypothetical protein